MRDRHTLMQCKTALRHHGQAACACIYLSSLLAAHCIGHSPSSRGHISSSSTYCLLWALHALVSVRRILC